MRGRPAKKVRKANLEAKTDESETSVPPLSPSKEFTFDADHGGRGKRQRKPTQKALESEIDLSSIVIKNEAPEPEVVDEITSKTEPAETSEQGTHFLAGADASSENPEKETKIDDPDKELSELQIAEDAPVDDKEKENKKPGVKVKKPRANIPCPRQFPDGQICGKMHRNEDHLEKHIMVVHEGIKPYLCDICGYGTNLRVKMDLHMATKHNEDKILAYVCEVCDYKCSNQLHLRAHLQIVHLEGLTPFECGVCQYQCRKRASVVKHMKIVHEKRRPFACQHCDKTFPVNSVLLRHVESVHERVRPHKCDICGYGFAERRFLEKHVKAVHEKIKPVSCEHCEYKCTTKDTLARHMWHKHERAPRFNCRMCDARFMRRTVLEEHYKTEHNQSYKAYVCDKCDYATDKKKRLDKHMAMDHSIGSVGRFKNMQCRDCKATFSKAELLAEHTEKEHNKKLESYGMVPVKRGRGRPPKHSYVNVGYYPAQDLTHIRPPAKRERTFYSSDEEDDEAEESDEDLAVLDEDDYDWKPSAAGLSAKKAQMMASKRVSKRGRKPKRMQEIYVPKMKSEIKEERTEFDHVPIVEGQGLPENIIDDQSQGVVYETTALEDHEQQVETTLDGASKIISITKKEPTEDQDPNESIKFAVKTRGSANEAPVEFEVELKDQKLIASGQLEDQTQTVMNLLSEGNVVDAILQNLAGVAQEQEQLVETDIEDPEQAAEDRITKKRWESKKFLCDDCGFTCASKATLNTHKMFKHGDLPPKSLTCDTCDYMCDHPTQLTSHKRIIHEEKLEPLECAHCPLQVRTQPELDKHLRNIHSEEKPFVCNMCGHRFNKKSNMVKHVKMVHEKLRPWTCEECNKSFSDRRDLVAHEDSVHKGLKPFDCPYCDYKCARKKNMYVHIKNIHGEKGSRTSKPSYECGQCGHVAKHRRLLEQHIRSVHEITVKEFQCGLCEFKAATKMSVDRHMQSHTKERRSLTAGECSMCGESFTNAAKLVAHMRNVHGTIDKTYQCESCEYRGATHSALKAHMRAVHENIRKHRCDYCEFTSFASSALKRHILAIHEKRKPFECDKCSFKSSYKESLELHLANKHKDEGVPEHLQIKAIRKKTRKSDRVETTIYETTLEPEYVTTEFVVTDATTEDHIAAHSIVAEEIPEEEVMMETVPAEAIIL